MLSIGFKTMLKHIFLLLLNIFLMVLQGFLHESN